jgi:hypothetical protein
MFEQASRDHGSQALALQGLRMISIFQTLCFTSIKSLSHLNCFCPVICNQTELSIGLEQRSRSGGRGFSAAYTDICYGSMSSRVGNAGFYIEAGALIQQKFVVAEVLITFTDSVFFWLRASRALLIFASSRKRRKAPRFLIAQQASSSTRTLAVFT